MQDASHLLQLPLTNDYDTQYPECCSNGVLMPQKLLCCEQADPGDLNVDQMPLKPRLQLIPLK